MLRIHYVASGTRVKGISVAFAGFQANYWEPVEPTEAQITHTEVKGHIDSVPTGLDDFNNCHHVELYGDVYPEMTVVVPGRTVSASLGYTLTTSSSISANRQFSCTDDGWYGFFLEEGSRIGYAQFWVWTDRAGCIGMYTQARYGFDSVYERDAAMERGKQYYESEKSRLKALDFLYHYPTLEGVVASSSNISNDVVAEAESWMASSDGVNPGEDAYREEVNNLLTSALVSTQDIPTLYYCTQIGFDGLIAQAIGQIWRSVPDAMRISEFRDLMRTWGQTHMALNWGVLAPFQDYIDLFKKLDEYYTYVWDPVQHKRVARGMTPFFWKASVARGHWSDDQWNVRLVVGIQWDYLKGSTLEDFFGILHAGGLSLTFEDTWDVIPFSFLVDWLVNISGILRTVDAKLSQWRYPVRYYWRTYLCERYIPLLGARVQVKVYDRRIVPMPSVRTTASWETLRGTANSSNFEDMAAFTFGLLA